MIDKRMFQDMREDIKYIETRDEKSFFISIGILFESLFNNKIRYENKKPTTHALRMKDVFSRLEVLDSPILNNVHNFLILLKDYRNEHSHNFKAEKELHVLKIELLSEIKNIFINGFSLSKDFKFDKENVETLVKNKSKDIIPLLKLIKQYEEHLEEIPEEDRNSIISTFDNTIYGQVSLIYFGFIGFLIGLDSVNNES